MTPERAVLLGNYRTLLRLKCRRFQENGKSFNREQERRAVVPPS